MTKDQVRSTEEALKLALEALEKSLPRLAPFGEQDWLDSKAAITAIKQALAAPVQEPYGQVTVVRNPGCAEQHWFYRWPEPPYLDNAAECHTVYTTPPNVATPLAASVQEPPDDGFTQALIERDEYHAIADELAEMIAQITGEDIGEHTSDNFPWRNALDAAENWLCHPPATPVQYELSPTDIYDFAGWLTTRKGVMKVGSSCEAGPMAEAVGEYLKTFPDRFTAAQRQWVGLTDEEVYEMADDGVFLGNVKEITRAIEAKLKEKNSD